MMRLSCLSEQLVRSWEQLVLKDTKKGFYYALHVTETIIRVSQRLLYVPFAAKKQVARLILIYYIVQNVTFVLSL